MAIACLLLGIMLFNSVSNDNNDVRDTNSCLPIMDGLRSDMRDCDSTTEIELNQEALLINENTSVQLSMISRVMLMMILKYDYE